jgi:hypothetical protein
MDVSGGLHVPEMKAWLGASMLYGMQEVELLASTAHCSDLAPYGQISFFGCCRVGCCIFFFIYSAELLDLRIDRNY